jgi:hypothetical protein
MEIKLLKLAIERLHDQVEQLSVEMGKVKEELAEIKKQNPQSFTHDKPTSMNLEDEYINTKDVQQILGVCYNTLRKVVEDGYLKPIRINQRRVRYNKADVIRYLERGT